MQLVNKKIDLAKYMEPVVIVLSRYIYSKLKPNPKFITCSKMILNLMANH